MSGWVCREALPGEHLWEGMELQNFRKSLSQKFCSEVSREIIATLFGAAV